MKLFGEDHTAQIEEPDWEPRTVRVLEGIGWDRGVCVCVHVWAQQKPLSSDPSSSLFCRLVEEGGSRHKNSQQLEGASGAPKGGGSGTVCPTRY